MKIHVPVKELDKWMESDRATAEPKIRYVILQSYMLRRVAEVEEPATVKRGQRDENR